MANHPHPDLEKLIQEGGLPHGQILLVGTGNGLEAVYLLERGYNVVGVDPDKETVVATREVVSHHGFFGFFQTGDPHQLPVEDGYFDAVFDFLGAPESEIRRVLKKGGRMFRWKR